MSIFIYDAFQCEVKIYKIDGDNEVSWHHDLTIAQTICHAISKLIDLENNK